MRWGSEMERLGSPERMSGSLLWATGAQHSGSPLTDSVEHTSLSHLVIRKLAYLPINSWPAVEGHCWGINSSALLVN